MLDGDVAVGDDVGAVGVVVVVVTGWLMVGVNGLAGLDCYCARGRASSGSSLLVGFALHVELEYLFV
jgi:hypothetical protein